jgi:transcriptional regulator with XRE-family HTH domain
MNTEEALITADLARAARALAQVSLADLAEHTDIDPERLRAIEQGRVLATAEESLLLHRALADFGVELLPADEHAGVGYGVRQKFNPRTVTRLENWENEGGPAGEDDI